ncbi:predicted protein [Micromonas commoda]|uniref:Uncharacterized protein n=1 Tax=Micromonas commoda (strain RCC299 / NOUM17 / CCMP2709) TaxID=296587 RepID=C1EHZ2_MICCC|nr:predicted protein [Micromonas commoda]ACO67767.1 predicted protein [Micromonas commoda]|eukprot:XP_002506509.1 predicted protein [Micromonas commoda]
MKLCPTSSDIHHPHTFIRRGKPVSHVEVEAGLLHFTRADVAVPAAVSPSTRCARARPRGASDTATVDAVKLPVAPILARVRGGSARIWFAHRRCHYPKAARRCPRYRVPGITRRLTRRPAR